MQADTLSVSVTKFQRLQAIVHGSPDSILLLQHPVATIAWWMVHRHMGVLQSIEALAWTSPLLVGHVRALYRLLACDPFFVSLDAITDG